MPDSIEKTILYLRSRILQEMKQCTGKFSTDIPIKKQAKNTTGKKNTWESLLFERDTIGIYLKFDIGARLDDAQKITLHGNEFGAVRLALYDREKSENFSIKIRKRDLFNKLGKLLSNEEIYRIENCNRNFQTLLGHVLVLHIKDTGKNWSIPNTDQLEKASADLVEKVVATLKHLLPVAEFYADNRDRLLAGKI